METVGFPGPLLIFASYAACATTASARIKFAQRAAATFCLACNRESSCGTGHASASINSSGILSGWTVRAMLEYIFAGTVERDLCPQVVAVVRAVVAPRAVGQLYCNTALGVGIDGGGLEVACGNAVMALLGKATVGIKRNVAVVYLHPLVLLDVVVGLASVHYDRALGTGAEFSESGRHGVGTTLSGEQVLGLGDFADVRAVTTCCEEESRLA